MCACPRVERERERECVWGRERDTAWICVCVHTHMCVCIHVCVCLGALAIYPQVYLSKHYGGTADKKQTNKKTLQVILK